jgi:hypothetical protein
MASDYSGKPKMWRRAAEILKNKYGIDADTKWSVEDLRKRLNSESTKKAAEDKKTEVATTTTAKAEAVTLPAKQTIDVQAPVMNVNIPAPSVTVHGQGGFSLAVAFMWCQAFALGASAAYILPRVLLG